MRSISHFVFPFVIFLLVLTAGGLFPLIFGGAQFYVFISVLLIFLMSLLKKIEKQSFNSFVSVFLWSILLSCALQLFNFGNLLTSEFPQFLFRVCVSITIAFLYACYKRNITDDIYLILKIIVIHALINFALSFFVEPFLLSVKVEEVIDVRTFYFLTFYQSNALLGNLLIFRNQGLFWEPGVLSVFLNIFIYLSLFEYQKKYWSILALILIVSTFSTTGIMLVFFQLIVYLKSWIKKNFLYFIPALGLISLLLPIVVYNASEKFKSDNGSFILRLYDYQVALNMIAENFLTGIGFGNQIYLKRQEDFSFFQNSSFTEPRLNTNSIIMVFVSFGIPLGGFILYKFYNQVIFQRKALFFFILIICLSSEPIAFTGFFLFVMYSSFFKNNYQLKLNLGN